MGDKLERGDGNCLLQVIFHLRDFHSASHTRVIDIAAIDSHALSTH